THDARCQLHNKEYYCTVGCQEGNDYVPWFAWKIADCLRERRDMIVNPTRKPRQWLRYHQCPFIPKTISSDEWELKPWSEQPLQPMPCSKKPYETEDLTNAKSCPYNKIPITIGLVVHDE